MADETVDQPVMTVEWWKASITALILAGVAFTTGFGWWHPTQEQITGCTTLAAVLIAIIFPIIAYFVHNRVTPNTNVALTMKDAQVLDAAQAPPVDSADLKALATGSYPPKEGDEKP